MRLTGSHIIANTRNEFEMDLSPAFTDPTVVSNLVVQSHLIVDSTSTYRELGLNTIHILVLCQHLLGLRFDVTILLLLDEAPWINFTLIALQMYTEDGVVESETFRDNLHFLNPQVIMRKVHMN